MSVCVCSSCSENCVPSVVTQGERVEWSKTFCNYSADEYELQYRFRGPGTGLDVDATTDGSGFDVEMTAALPAFDATGEYHWQAWLTETADPTNTFVIEQGRTTIKPGFVAADDAEIDLRSPARIALDSIDAAMSAFATSDVQEYEIATPAGSRRVKRSARKDLMDLRKHYAMIVSMENTKERLRNGGRLMKSIGIVVREC